MSKTSRILRKARAELRADTRPIARAKGPADVIAMIPYLLGFSPADSIVLIALQGPRRRFGPCLRMDLAPAAGAIAQVDYLMSIVEAHSFGTVLLVAFSDDPVSAAEVVEPLLRRLDLGGVTVTEAIRADGNRWYSYACDNPDCCDPDGTPYDCESSIMSAQAVVSGMTKATNRDALRGQFEPNDLALCAEVAEQCQEVSATNALDVVAGLVDDSLLTPAALSASQLACLAVAVQSTAGMNQAWNSMTRDNAASKFELWLRVMQVVPDPLLPAVGSLAAFAAWLDGRGVLASHAAERVQRVDPAYPMMLFLLQLLEQTVHPREWKDMPSLRRALT
ncbi:MAG: DUF4192 domain-containing protein [Nocardioidaceae bacterium]